MEGSRGEGPEGFSLLEFQPGGLRVPSGVTATQKSSVYLQNTSSAHSLGVWLQPGPCA